MKKLSGKKKQKGSKPSNASKKPTKLDEDREIYIPLSQKHKEQGNTLFKKRDHEGAILNYEKALKLLPKNHIDVVYLRCRMADCYMLMGVSDFPQAVDECSLALEVAPKCSKALLNRARCYEALNMLDLAFRDVTSVLAMEPENTTALEFEKRVRKAGENKGSIVDEESEDKAAVYSIEDIDKISQLPVHLMHHILSFLPTKEVVRATILSKSWKIACTMFPILLFDASYFRAGQRGKNYERVRRKREELFDYVEQTLQSRANQMLSISKLRINVPYFNSEVANRLDRCIGYGFDCNVKDLNFNLHCKDGWYRFPHDTVFAARSTTKCALNRLILWRVHLDDQFIQNLVSSCPSLNDLLIHCRGLTSFKISGLHKLKIIHLRGDFRSIEIEAFQLQSFTLGGNKQACEINISTCVNLTTLELSRIPVTEKWLRDNFSVLHSLKALQLSSLISFPYNINMSPCKNLTSLEFHGVIITEEYWFHDLFFNCPLLENLELSNCHTWESIKISSHQPLKKLSSFHCENLVKFEIDTPNLLSFIYYGNKNITSLSLNSLAVSEVIFYLDLVDDITWSVEATEFLRKFNHCKHLKLRENLIIPQKARETLLPPLYYVNQLTLTIERRLKSHDFVELVEALLWMSPRLEIMVVNCLKNYYYEEMFSIKFVYEQKVDRKADNCFCASLPIICWRHCLKEVRVENLRGVKEKRSLKNFFLQNAEILDKIVGLT